MVDIRIRKATADDAPVIAEGIVMAIGPELAEGIANGQPVQATLDVFTELARMEDSQYSYRNAFVAETQSGEPVGIVVAYDGEILLKARWLFFDLAKSRLGWDIRDIVADGEPEVETDPSEYYLDSLAVRPEFRGHGIASLLIERVIQQAKIVGKPVGLLCASHNDNARRLYEKIGFRQVGIRSFAGEDMSHMVFDPSSRHT